MGRKMRQKAIDLLGQYAIDRRSEKISERWVEILSAFLEKHKDKNCHVLKNRSLNYPPKKSKWSDFDKIGGVMQSYHLWAVAE